MTEHKATPGQWEALEEHSWQDAYSCTLELRARVEALELWRATTDNAAPIARDRAEDAPESSDLPVERVARAISGCGNMGPTNWWKPEARAAIHTIADWLDQQHLHVAAARLRQEVGVMTDPRELIKRMAEELDLYRQIARDNCTSTHPLADEARAYLAQTEPEGAITEPRGCPTPGACSCPTAPYVPPELIRALELAEAALADIGDADRESGDDLAWAEARAAQDLPRIRAVLARRGSQPSKVARSGARWYDSTAPTGEP
jgi:hypothetical protein